MGRLPIPYMTDPATGQVRIKSRTEAALRAGAQFMGEDLAPIRTEPDLLHALLAGGIGLALKDLLETAVARSKQKPAQESGRELD